MKKKAKKKEEKSIVEHLDIRLDIYRRTVVIFLGAPTVEQIVESAIKHKVPEKYFTHGWKDSVQDAIKKGSAGFCTPLGEDARDLMIWLRERLKTATQYGVLYHELHHAVDFVAVGVDPEDRMVGKTGISEAKAYLFEFLVNECNTTLWKKDETR